MTARHVPVMVDEIVRLLAVRPGGIYVDATVGLGGHARALLKAGAPNGTLIGIDRDDAALAVARERLASFGERVTLVQANFSDLHSVVHRCGAAAVDGLLADLGMSSLQLDTAARGFAFQRSGPLDMRMDRSQGVTAATLVNTASEQELALWFFRYGEERFAKRVARAVVARRAERLFTDTVDFAEAVRRAVPARYRHGKIDAATRVFQALRIVVNGELLALERLLDVAPRLLAPEGRVAVLSYHSLEDRSVKERFRALAAAGRFALITKKPLVATPAEVRANPRARSAKLRVAMRVAGEGTTS